MIAGGEGETVGLTSVPEDSNSGGSDESRPSKENSINTLHVYN